MTTMYFLIRLVILLHVALIIQHIILCSELFRAQVNLSCNFCVHYIMWGLTSDVK